MAFNGSPEAEVIPLDEMHQGFVSETTGWRSVTYAAEIAGPQRSQTGLLVHDHKRQKLKQVMNSFDVKLVLVLDYSFSDSVGFFW